MSPKSRLSRLAPSLSPRTCTPVAETDSTRFTSRRDGRSGRGRRRGRRCARAGPAGRRATGHPGTQRRDHAGAGDLDAPHPPPSDEHEEARQRPHHHGAAPGAQQREPVPTGQHPPIEGAAGCGSHRDRWSFSTAEPACHRTCALRPAVRSLRPGAGAHRGRVGKGLHGEVRGVRRRGLPGPRAWRSRRSAASSSSTTSGCCGRTTSSLSTSRRSPSCTTSSGGRTKAAGAAKKTNDVTVAEALLNDIMAIDLIFQETKH